jgi:hypothetical protein
MCESEKLKRTVKPNRCVSVFLFFVNGLSGYTGHPAG